MQDTLYREEILEHYKNPQNFGKPLTFSVSSSQTNPFCGDAVSVYITFDKSRVKDASFTGQGCAISVAAASILTEYAKEKDKNTLTKMTEKDMLTLLGIEVSETRKKCALLAFATLKDTLT